jgi:hypothetical protein
MCKSLSSISFGSSSAKCAAVLFPGGRSAKCAARGRSAKCAAVLSPGRGPRGLVCSRFPSDADLVGVRALSGRWGECSDDDTFRDLRCYFVWGERASFGCSSSCSFRAQRVAPERCSVWLPAILLAPASDLPAWVRGCFCPGRLRGRPRFAPVRLCASVPVGVAALRVLGHFAGRLFCVCADCGM